MTVITFTKPMVDFSKFFANGAEIEKKIDLTQCTEFWPKGTNSEALIYSGRQIVFSCCYTEYKRKMYITSVWAKSGCVYEYDINYNA